MSPSLILWWKSAKLAADGLFTVASLFAVPAIVIAPMVWMSEHPGSMRSSLHVVSVGNQRALSGGLEFSEKPLKVVYHLELSNPSTGESYRYPQVDSRGVPQFDNVMLQVPGDAPKGEYQLKAAVHYVVNPLKAVDRVVEVAQIRID